MSHVIRVCVDLAPPPKTSTERLALIKGNKWNAGDVIRIRFLGGAADLQNKVKKYAVEWTKYANLKLYFAADPNADIRIAFVSDGSWSTIGTGCHAVPAPEATMNYGWLDSNTPDAEIRRVVLHEFGHALGCIHEHQNPAGGIHWNKQAVYDYYAGPPNNWSKAKVDQNLFKTYSANLTSYTKLDGSSIMMYPIPKAFTTDGYQVGLNSELSAKDREFIGNMYPLS